LQETKLPLVWRENGPGVGWEMRNAWSGIFGRFFARAFLEARGYTWFHAIRRSYNPVTDDLVVIRIGNGEVADWLCARDQDAADEGDLIVAEAKGRHREGDLELQKLPRSLQSALEQIDNTFVVRRGVYGPEFRRTKGFAVLVRWANEEKSSGGAILRSVDPHTWGDAFSTDERKRLTQELARGYVSDLSRGLGFEGLSFLASPRTREWGEQENREVIEKVREVVVRRPLAVGISSHKDILENEQRALQTKQWLLDRIDRSKHLRVQPRRPAYSKSPQELRVEAASPLPIVRLTVTGLDTQRFIGAIYGMHGRINLPLDEVIRSLRTLQQDVAQQLVFVGIRVRAVRDAGNSRNVRKWQVPVNIRQSAYGRLVYASTDNVVIAPAGLLELSGRRRLF
jgi:hypothetical protein